MKFTDTIITHHQFGSDGALVSNPIPESPHLESSVVRPCLVQIRFNRSQAKNAISGLMVDEVERVFDVAESNSSEVRAIILSGDSKAFCAGAELESLRSAKRQADSGDLQSARALLERVYQVFLRPLGSTIPTIACIDGAAVGAGLNIALGADVRIASVGAYFESRFLKIGLHPGGGHTWLLDRAIGSANAKRMALFNQRIDAAEATRIGLVQQLTSDPVECERAAIELARPLMDANRDLMLAIKGSLGIASRSTHEDTLRHETDVQVNGLSRLTL